MSATATLLPASAPRGLFLFGRVERARHSTTRITEDLYQHVRIQVSADAAERVVALLPGEDKARVTRS